MKKLINIQIPKFFIIFGYIIILIEYFAGILMDFSLGQQTVNMGLIFFILGATPVLFHSLKKMSADLFEK